MSLSFVSSAVLSSTDGISHNEEISIDNNETQSLRAGSGGGGGTHKPLFEQLRANRDQQQERDDKFQRSIRGTRALDEEDCAHLAAVERMRVVKEHDARSTVEREVELFRAAREDRGLAQTMVDGGCVGEDIIYDDDDDRESVIERRSRDETIAQQISNSSNSNKSLIDGSTIAKKERIQIVPKFTIKKKRKTVPSSSSQELDKDHKRTVVDNDVAKTTTDNVFANECGTAKGNAPSCSVTTEGKNEYGTNDNEAPSRSEEKKTTGAQNQSRSDNYEQRGGVLGLGCYGSDSD